MTRADHVARAEAAYTKYRKIQERISAYEAYVSQMFPHNDRLVAAFLKESEEPNAWVYRTLCKSRAVEHQIIAVESAMASLYQT